MVSLSKLFIVITLQYHRVFIMMHNTFVYLLVVTYFRFTELTPSEAELCLSVGVNPEFFLNTKRVLWADCKKSNGMVLKRARKLVKIDVNKTRKIFDFFMEQGILWPPGKQL